MNQKTDKSYNFSSLDLLIYMWRKRWILLIVSFVAGVTSILVSFTIKEKFQSSVILFPSTGASVSKALLAQNYTGRQNVYGFGEEEQAEQLLQVLNSEGIRNRIIEKYNLMEHYEIDLDDAFPYTRLDQTYRTNINFRRTEYMSVEISVMDTDPQVAADIANDIAALIDTVFNDMKKQRAAAAFILVEREYEEAVQNLESIKDSIQYISNLISQELKSSGRANEMAEVIRALSKHGGSYYALANKINHEQDQLANLRQRMKEARVEAEQNLPYKFIVDNAYPSEKKAYPKKSVIVIISTASAFLLTLILLIIIDTLKERAAVKEEE